jgi:hypothetical protein
MRQQEQAQGRSANTYKTPNVMSYDFVYSPDMYSYGDSNASKSAYYRPGNSNTNLRRPPTAARSHSKGRPSTGKSHKYQQMHGGQSQPESSLTFSQMRSQKYQEDESPCAPAFIVNQASSLKKDKPCFSDSQEAARAEAEADLKLSGPSGDEVAPVR